MQDKEDQIPEDVTSLETWNAKIAQNSTVTTEQLDEAGKKYDEAYSKYEEAKKVASDLLKDAEVLESKLIELLKLSGKTKYYIENLGTYSFTHKMSVQTPKSVEDKQKLGKWLEKQGGKVYFWETFSINSQTLQALYKRSQEEFAALCEKQGKPEKIATFHIPGLLAPTAIEGLKFTADKKAKKGQ